MKKQKTVYVFNMSEDVWPFILAMNDSKQRQFEINENANLSDRELFSNINEKHLVYISPQPISQEFIEYFKRLSGITDLEILVVKNHSGLICEDIISDNAIFKRLIELGKDYELVFKSYSASPQFYLLINKLREKKITVSIPESPEESDSWTVNFYGSKGGVRQTVYQLFKNDPTVCMPTGYIVGGIDTGSKIAADWYSKHHKVVIKTNKGHAGAGVLIFQRKALPTDYLLCRAKILEVLKKDEYWSHFPVIVEDCVDVNFKIGGGFPNLEFRILPDGKVKYLYQCGMRVSAEGVFGGVEIHDGVFPPHVFKKILKVGTILGNQYAKDGYRGNFDIDFAAGTDGKYYINESNIHRTGGTYVYETALKLSGENFLEDVYILSTNIYKLPEKKTFSFKDILQKLEPILYSEKTKEGVVIASANLLHQASTAYMVIGKDEARALKIEAQMKKLLK